MLPPPPGLPMPQVIQASTMNASQYLSSKENQAQSEEIPIAQDEQNMFDQAYISQYMDVKGAKEKEEDQTAGTPIHTMVETPQELAARLAEEEKEIQVLALTWDTEGVFRYYTAEAIKNERKKLDDRQIFVNLKKMKNKSPSGEEEGGTGNVQPAKFTQLRTDRTVAPISAMVSVTTVSLTTPMLQTASTDILSMATNQSMHFVSQAMDTSTSTPHQPKVQGAPSKPQAAGQKVQIFTSEKVKLLTLDTVDTNQQTPETTVELFRMYCWSIVGFLASHQG
uniref:Uncharacterized protein n=1 Tax=Romanomermis culicivorax TaxID=13658 RepID=A0A915JQK9_ROMCU